MIEFPLILIGYALLPLIAIQLMICLLYTSRSTAHLG